MIRYFFAGELWHGDRIHLGGSGLTTPEQLAGVFTGIVGTTEIFAKTPRLELHVTTAFITLNQRTFIPLELENAGFHFKAIAVGVVATNMQLSPLINQIGIHCRIAEYP